MKNNFTLITTFSIIVLMLVTISYGDTAPCAVGMLRYSVLTEREESVSSLAFNPKHNDILAVGRSKITEASDGIIEYDGTIELWDTSTGELLHTLWGHADAVLTLAFSPDGKTLASGSADGTVGAWNTDMETPTDVGKRQATFDEHNDLVLSLAFLTESGNAIASGSRDGSIRFWNPKTGQQQIFTLGPAVFSLASSRKRNLLATGRADNVIRVWNFRDGKQMHTFEGHDDPVTSLAFNDDGNMLISGSADGTVKLWDIGTSAPPQEFTPSSDWVNSVALHGTTLASANFNGAIFLWDIDTKKLLYTLTGHSGSVESITFDSDGKTLASGGHDGKVLLWDLTQPKIEADVNGDNKIGIADLKAVDSRMGMTGQNTADANGDADVNADDIVNIADLVLVSYAISCPTEAAAPSVYKQAETLLTVEQVQQWLTQARLLGETSPAYQRGVLMLEQLLVVLTPKQTSLLANYPNPFNPETWIPYQLANPADVTLTIYDIQGHVVQDLDLGHQRAGIYQSRARAAHWDGRNAHGEPVASGLYFYTLTAEEFTATRKMLIRK